MNRTINYVWFSKNGRPLPDFAQKAISTWRKYLPGWEIREWNSTNFEVDKFRWVREAIQAGRFAFAADFVRLYVLYNEGGIFRHGYTIDKESRTILQRKLLLFCRVFLERS